MSYTQTMLELMTRFERLEKKGRASFFVNLDPEDFTREEQAELRHWMNMAIRSAFWQVKTRSLKGKD